MEFTGYNFKDLFPMYRRAMLWMQGHGLRVNPTSRLAKYENTLRELSRMVLPESKAMFVENNRDLVLNTIYEAYGLIYLHRSLSIVNISGLSKLLSVIEKGPEYYTQETGRSNRPRNEFYELMVFATMLNAGIVAERTKQREDVNAVFEGTTVFAECKRPMNRESLVGAVADAIDQLHSRFNGSTRPEAKGIIFLSLDKVINHDLHDAEFATNQEFQEHLQTIGKSLTNRAYRQLNDLADPRILGVIGQMRVPATVRELFSTIGFGTFDLGRYENESNKRLMGSFLTRYLSGWNRVLIEDQQ